MRFRKIFTRLCQLPGVIIPIALLGYISWVTSGHNFQSAASFIWIIVVTLCVCFACGALIKFIYHKERPKPKEFKNRRQKIDASSFPSIHTAYATIFMCAAFIIGFVGSVDSPMITWNEILIYVSGVIFYVLIAASRIVLKKHFFIDIVFGTLLGLVAVSFAWTHLDAILAVLTLAFGWK